jgi:hypothetical protein
MRMGEVSVMSATVLASLKMCLNFFYTTFLGSNSSAEKFSFLSCL